MNNERQAQDTCGCCEGITQSTSALIENRPGLSSVAYRAGVHGSFKASMLAALGRERTLRGLTTRDSNDFTIAFLDAWAVVADVLTFYQERIANESYLRTAMERFSVQQLARLIGYQLSPGVAAGTYLAFTIDEPPKLPQVAVDRKASQAYARMMPPTVKIEKGTKVQSIPGQNEQAQVFETVEAIEARTDWNELKPKMTESVKPKFGDEVLYVKGVPTDLKAGDAVLLVGDERIKDPGNENWEFRRVEGVTEVKTVDPASAYTIIKLERGLGSYQPKMDPSQVNPQLFVLRQRANLFGYNAPDWRVMPARVQAGYLGKSEEAIDIAIDKQWPNFNLVSLIIRNGLFAEYFDGPDLINRKAVQIDDKVDFDWTPAKLPPALDADVFSVRWTGLIVPEITGEHTFKIESDGGYRLWVGDNRGPLISNWTGGAGTTGAKINLNKDEPYDLRLEYRKQAGVGTAKIKLFLRDDVVIPSKQLYPSDIQLDAVYPNIVPGSWLVLSIPEIAKSQESPEYPEVFRIEAVAEDARADFTLVSKTTRITITGEHLRKYNDKLRDTAVYAQSDRLELADRPLITPQPGAPSEMIPLDRDTMIPVEGDTIVLDRKVEALQKGQKLIVYGKRMRLRVPETAKKGDVRLSPFDGSPAQALEPGQTLTVLSAPRVDAAENVRWHARTAGGIEGTIEAARDQVFLCHAFPEDEETGEIVEIDETSGDPTVVTLLKSLAMSYDRATVTVFANVARATHGETVREVLGSGDASQPFQRFTLRQLPLTHVGSPTASGREMTLAVRVNDILWKEVPTLLGHGPDERIYATRDENDGMAVVQFGDGRTGARIPTGQENIRAVYRKGIGLGGLVKAGQLSLLMDRPLGVKEVVNPLPATGAEDPEKLDQARLNAPLTVLTMGRVVSLQDYEDFVRAFAGIAKALATVVWNGEKRAIFITVAGPKGAEVVEGSNLHNNLMKALRDAGDSTVSVNVKSYRPVTFTVRAAVKIHPDYLFPKVRNAVQEALTTRYSFDARQFGQYVAMSEVVSVVQAVPGVTAVRLEELRDQKGNNGLQQPLRAALPEQGMDDSIAGAELLTINPRTIAVEEMS
jgi:hypothetical protein